MRGLRDGEGFSHQAFSNLARRPGGTHDGVAPLTLRHPNSLEASSLASALIMSAYKNKEFVLALNF